jgi:signal transduction histidine kinase
MLTAIKIDLSFLDRRIPDNLPQLKEKAGNLVALTESAMQTVRKISSDLRPSILDNLGLLPALEWLAQEFQQRMGIKCFMNVETEAIDTEPERATAIFRIFQEALTNVARHAQASLVRVGVEQTEGDLILTVRDNGVGITKDKVLSIDSFGILGMHERARRFGGKVSIVGGDENGTVVTLVFPLASTAKEETA